MRTITIRYKYSGPEDAWNSAMSDFISSIDGDEAVAGKFTYQVSTADDGESRIHWGRWDSDETLKALQSTEYFKAFAEKVKEFSGGPPDNIAANVKHKTGGW